MVLVDFLSGNTEVLLKKTLDATMERQRVIANNIANMDTPGFKRSTVEFDGILASALEKGKVDVERTHPRHLSSTPDLSEVKPEVKKDLSTSMNGEGNNVDIETEMIDMAMNSLNFEAVAKLMATKIGQQRYVISDGRR